MNNEKEQLEFKMKQQGEIIANRDKQIEDLRSDLTGLEDKLKKERDLLRSSEKDRLAEKTKLIECVAKIQFLEEKLKDSQQNDRVRVLSSENGRLERELHEASDKLAKAKEASDDREQQLDNEVLKSNVGGREVIVTPRSLENAEDDEDEEEKDEDDEGYDSDKESNEYGSEEDIVSEIASSHKNTSEMDAPAEQKEPWPPP
ncbi:glutamic acid-rich protein-like [Anopheles ziemanni]|uniref:glutamic acid-rich protein-like n=1 Tax=Anopheles coustani TaxID=139045 RepID=UPI00265AFF9E|nr:glutamic acid-rich protein-like [Anopheles coustani]XP_058176791.1 glutamic acid-rich protein-like [Anopheles ziemanni]